MNENLRAANAATLSSPFAVTDVLNRTADALKEAGYDIVDSWGPDLSPSGVPCIVISRPQFDEGLTDCRIHHWKDHGMIAFTMARGAPEEEWECWCPWKLADDAPVAAVRTVVDCCFGIASANDGPLCAAICDVIEEHYRDNESSPPPAPDGEGVEVALPPGLQEAMDKTEAAEEVEALVELGGDLVNAVKATVIALRRHIERSWRVHDTWIINPEGDDRKDVLIDMNADLSSIINGTFIEQFG